MSKFKKIASTLDLFEPLTITYKGEPVMVIKPYQTHLRELELVASIVDQLKRPGTEDLAI